MHNETVIGKAGNFNICFREVALSSHSGAVLLKEFCDQLKEFCDQLKEFCDQLKEFCDQLKEFCAQLGVAEVLDEEVKVKQRARLLGC